MMAWKILPINSCYDCPFFQLLAIPDRGYPLKAPYCAKEHPFRIIDEDSIYQPEWCPLPEIDTATF